MNPVSQSAFARKAGCSRSTVRDAINAGRIELMADGKIDLDTQLQAFSANRDQAKARSKQRESTGAFATERMLLTRAQREKAELELATARGELHRTEDIEAALNSMVGAFRTRMLAIPTKAAGELVGRTSLPEIREVLTRHIHEALTELSNYDGNTRSKSRRKGTGQDS